MPSIRGYKKGINDKALRDVVDKYTAHVATVAAQAGKSAMYDLRRQAVENWYSSTGSNHMNKALKVESDKPKQGNRKIEITIRSYIDIDVFEESKRGASERNKYSSPYESVRRWRERHEKDGWRYYGKEQVRMDENDLNKLGIHQPSRPAINMPYSIGEYLFRLPWEEGIVGLPPKERFTDTGWVNPAKKRKNTRRSTLEGYVNKYMKKRWPTTVKDEFAKLSK